MPKSDINNFLTENNIELKAYFGIEVLRAINDAPADACKEPYIVTAIENTIGQCDLTASFDNKILAIVYDEVLTIEIYNGIYKWLRMQLCNIEKIVVIITHTLGFSAWAAEYHTLMAECHPVVIDIPTRAYYFKKVAEAIPTINNIRLNYSSYFDYYGGRYSTSERDFLVLLWLTRKDVVDIKYAGGLSLTVEQFDAYIECISGFINREICDEICNARSDFQPEYPLLPVFLSTDIVPDNLLDIGIFNIIRETVNTESLVIFTEKTIKCIVKKQIPLPLGYNTVALLEDSGFRFNHALVDYSYQAEPIFFKRMLLLRAEMDRIVSTYSKAELIEIINKPNSTINYNYNYVVSGEYTRISEATAIRKIKEIHGKRV